MGMLNYICVFFALTAGISAYGQTEAPLPTEEPQFMPFDSDDSVYIDTDEGDEPEIPGCVIGTIQADGCYVPSDFEYEIINDTCVGDVLYEQIKVGTVCDTEIYDSTKSYDCQTYCTTGMGHCSTVTLQACNHPAGTGTKVGYCECPEPSI